MPPHPNARAVIDIRTARRSARASRALMRYVRATAMPRRLPRLLRKGLCRLVPSDGGRIIPGPGSSAVPPDRVEPTSSTQLTARGRDPTGRLSDAAAWGTLAGMPLINVYTSAEPPSEDRSQKLLGALSRTLARVLGKPESYVMTCLVPRARMTFAGSLDPACWGRDQEHWRHHPRQRESVDSSCQQGDRRGVRRSGESRLRRARGRAGHMWGFQRFDVRVRGRGAGGGQSWGIWSTLPEARMFLPPEHDPHVELEDVVRAGSRGLRGERRVDSGRLKPRVQVTAERPATTASGFAAPALRSAIGRGRRLIAGAP